MSQVFLIDKNLEVLSFDMDSCNLLNESDCNVLFKKVPHIDGICKTTYGADHTLFLDIDRKIWFCGNSLAVGSYPYIVQNEPKKILESSIFLDIAAGNNYSLLLDVNGEVWICGQDPVRKNNEQIHPQKLSTLPNMGDIPKISQICCRYDLVILLDCNGDLWILWRISSSPYKIHGLPPVAKFCLAENINIVDINNDVWICSDFSTCTPFRKIDYLPPIVDCCGNTSCTFLLDTDGKLWFNNHLHFFDKAEIFKQLPLQSTIIEIGSCGQCVFLIDSGGYYWLFKNNAYPPMDFDQIEETYIPQPIKIQNIKARSSKTKNAKFF